MENLDVHDQKSKVLQLMTEVYYKDYKKGVQDGLEMNENVW